ncbi:MAG: hypothetical protein H8E10_21665 [Desulfobacterales bacterium]|nr:hypothetical protein [Desulfobacterales bacterium]MBL7102045.1 hypothetical protein [Desulfobacteraceae bacterium]MBL7173044.1 hypothetical protein [Desulfobacteraceae bacterium]
MDIVIKNYLEQLKVGRKQSYKNLSLYPLLSTYSSGLDYLLLDEALSENLIEVVEVGSDGSVPELKVVNKSPKLILILDGEELVGAKQNRIVNTTILIQRNTTIVIPVSCVEHGRWSYDSPRFHSQKRMMSSNLRAMKTEQVNYSVRSSGKFRADQGAIWDGIAEKAIRMAAPSPTGAMAAIYDKERPSIEEYMGPFGLIESQVGAIFMINGRVAGLDAFGKPGTFSKVFKKLLESYALDAIDWYDPDKEHKALKREVTRFRKAALSANAEARPSVGLGTDFRLESKKVTGFALALDEQVLHISIFARADGRDTHGADSQIERFSRRRQNRRG